VHAGGDGAPADETVSIKFDKDMELASMLDAMSAATGRPVLYDPNSQRIRAQKVGVNLEMKVPASRLFDAFRAIIATWELTLVPIGPHGYEVYLVIDSRSTNNFVKNKAQFLEAEQVPEYRDRDGLYVAAFFPLSNVSNMTMVRTALSSLVSPAGVGRVMEIPDVGLIVMDFAPTVYTMQELLKRLDVPNQATQVLESFELKYGRAAEVAYAVQELWTEIVATGPQGTRAGIRMSGPPPRIVPYAARNAVVARGTREEVEMIRGLIAKIDQPARTTAQTVDVIRLKHIHAHVLVNTLNAVLAAPTALDPTARVVADPQSNAIILSGSPYAVPGIKDIIAALDLPRVEPEPK
jgi:type II secretory pathway component GspD/PulD (secretin)